MRRFSLHWVKSKQPVLLMACFIASCFVLTWPAVFSLMQSRPPGLAASLPPLPPLPLWKLQPGKPAGDAKQVVVLKTSQDSTTAPPNSTINIVTRFNVTAPLTTRYQLILALVDAAGNTIAEKRNDLNNNQLVLPTTAWLGPIAITNAFPIPKAPDGTYSIRVGLDGPWGPIALTPGDGVAEDSQFRYRIGTVVLKASASAPNLLPPPTLDLSGYKMTFDDEFKSLSISDSALNDGAAWYTLNEKCCMTTSDGTATEMVGLSNPTNPYSLIPGGGLDIRLQKTSGRWTSGVLTSVDSTGKGFSQQYGYFEMKAKFPAGQNTWPSFWLLSTAAKATQAPAGEIDIVEYIANPAFPNFIATTVHDWSKNAPEPQLASHYPVPLPTAGFHTYGMLWTPTTMTFYFDGAVTFQVPTPSIMHQPYYLLLDLGIGAGWPTGKTPSVNDMQIQYVRAYQPTTTSR